MKITQGIGMADNRVIQSFMFRPRFTTVLAVFFLTGFAYASPLNVIIGFSESRATSPYEIKVSGERFQTSVTGVITDANGVPLSGASVVVKGTTTGTVADFDGNYTINVPSDGTLVFSYVGYSAVEVPVNGQETVNVTMEEDAAALDEVVVVGYGTQRKSDVTGAITSVSGEDLNVTRDNNPLNALAGKVAGLEVELQSSAPGANPSLLVRGRSSLNFSNAPLIVLDGVPFEGNLSNINSADIASIEVLKDASSAAIYGARGANGVILVTTKRGTAGKATFTYDTYYGFAELSQKYNLLDADGYVDVFREAIRARDEQQQGLLPGTLPIPSVEDVLDPLQLEAYRAGVNTDYQDLGFRTGEQVSHQLGVSGGSEDVRYALSLSYFNQEGVYRLADFERYTFRTNIDVYATDKLKFGLSQQINYSKRNSYDQTRLLFAQSPLQRPFNDDGTPTIDPLNDGLRFNTLSNEVNGNYIDETLSYGYVGNIFGSYQISEPLKYTLNIQPQFESITDNDFRSNAGASAFGGLSSAGTETRVNTAYTIENILNYSKIFNDIHSLDATLLYSFQETQRDFSTLQTSGPASNTQTFNNFSDASIIDLRDSSLETEAWTSYMGRFIYGFDNRYLLTLTGRYDGSSKLSEGNKWGFFPSASVAWRIIEEGFMSEQSTFNDLKLRVGYGTVGRNPIAPFATLGGIRRFASTFGQDPAIGFAPEQIANPELKWEITTTFDAGLDFALLDNRISGSIDYYRGTTTDLLLNRVLPATSGFSSVLQNVGETENSGIEVVLSTLNIDKEFKWMTDFNFSANQNKISKLLDSENDDIGNGWFIGEPLSVYYDRVFDGIWQISEADLADSYGRIPGQIKLADLDNNGEFNDDDRKILGQQDPKWIAGVTSRMEYKGFDLVVAAYTRQGNLTRARALQNITIFGRFNDLDLDYWTPENPTNAFPRPNRDRQRPLDDGVISYVDGSLVRIRNITLGYSFEPKVSKYLGLEKLRFYATAQNPFLFTSVDLDGFDPELGAGGDGDDYLAAPRTILFGVNLSF